MFIQRNYNRTEHDDFVLNVQNHLRDDKEVVPIYDRLQKDEDSLVLLGWLIQRKYE